MKTVIYMNHHIKEKDTAEPVIAVMKGKNLIYTSTVTIRDSRGKAVAKIIYRKSGLNGVPHKVLAWVETNNFVELMP